MGPRPILALALSLVACNPPAFVCQSAEQCANGGAGAVCEPDGYCSFDDAACDSGRRYGEHSGPRSNECVEVSATTSTGAASESTAVVDPTTSTGTPGSSESSSTIDPSPTSSTSTDDTSTGPPPPDPQPLLWFAFEDDLTDGFDNDGRLGTSAMCMGETCPLAIEGPVGNAAQFDGIDDCGVFAFVPDLNTYDAFSISVWLRRDVIGTSYDAILTKPVGTGAWNTWRLALQNLDDIDTLHWHVGLADNTGAELNPPLGSLEWVHVVATWDGVSLEMWTDGVLNDSIPSTLIEWDEQSVFVGCDDDHNGLTGFFLGGLDELRLYGRVLDPDEIATLATP